MVTAERRAGRLHLAGERDGASTGLRAAGAERTPTEELQASLRRLLATLLDRAVGVALEQVEALARWLDEVAARGGVRLNALLGGARAAVGGRSPVWGAVVGAMRGMSPATRVALIVVLVLAVLLLPVTVLLVLLFLIVAAIVAAVRASAA
jgi:membrane associated rhomboid family serine protease